METMQYLICVVVIGVVGADDPGWSRNVLNFLAIFNGRMNNSAQISEGFSDHDLIQVINKPVDVPVLRQRPVVFTEEASNGKVNILQLGVISEGAHNVINLKLYNFTKNIDHKPGTFNFDVLQNITLEDLQGESACVASFVPVNEDGFLGNWADCRHTNHRTHPTYPLFYACGGTVVASIPVAVTEAHTVVPYVFTIQERYPLVYAPENYVSPCDNKTTPTCTKDGE